MCEVEKGDDVRTAGARGEERKGDEFVQSPSVGLQIRIVARRLHHEIDVINLPFYCVLKGWNRKPVIS